MAIRKEQLDSETAKAYEAWRKEFSVEDLLEYTKVTKTFPLKDTIAELEAMEAERLKKMASRSKKKR